MTSAPAGIPDPKLYETLGALYLGRAYDADADTATDDLLLYDAKDLTTHAVCVGMTGSGKTGLCVALLEEAAIDGIPAIVIDPKGDLGNLVLTFPHLRPEDFRPWVDEQEALRNGLSVDDYAAQVAERWRSGLAAWGQDAERIRRLRDASEVSIYTPGSTAGRPVTVLKSFAAPEAALLADADAFRERVGSAASGLMALVGEDPDPIRSRAHILVANLLERAWREGRDLDVPQLIAEIQQPPLDRIGVMEVDQFFPANDRFELAMRLNALVASPGFASWMEGEPLDIRRLLWTEDGRPRISVVSIAHLSDPERMFFVTILLNEVVAWMRSQPGTNSLRALLYMDEVFGFFPPTANPPSKTPMLTLLKQARAFGLGVVLATQNPVDLDYKGLSNAGTWFLGRLQTERDKLRVLEGLEGASAANGAAFDRGEIDRLLSGLKSRVFLMNNVHDDAPVVFQTRWVMSYLRGPLTRAQISTLMASADSVVPSPTPRPPSQARPTAHAGTADRPVLDEGVDEFFAMADEGAHYTPAVYGVADIHLADTKSGIDEWRTVTYVSPLVGKRATDPWASAELVGPLELADGPVADPTFGALPKAARAKTRYTAWKKSFKTFVYRDQSIETYRCAKLKLLSEPGESEGEFRVRLREAARQQRDLKVEKLRNRYAPKLARLQERIRTAERKVEREQAQYGQQKMQTAISVGATVLGALLGRRAASVGTVGRATTAARGLSRAAREREDIAHAAERLEELQAQLEDLEAKFQDEVAELESAADPDAYAVTTKTVRPKKTDTTVTAFGLVWMTL